MRKDAEIIKIISNVMEFASSFKNYPIDSKECLEHRKAHKNCIGCFHEKYCQELAKKGILAISQLLILIDKLSKNAKR